MGLRSFTGRLPKLTTGVSVVVPAYNEAESVGRVVRGLKAPGWPWLKEVLVVSDGSSDDTAKVAAEAGAEVVEHSENLGYGAALKTGIRAASGDAVATIDADGQHEPADLATLVQLSGEADLVIGERQPRIHSPLWRMPGKWLISAVARYVVRRKIPDLNCGYRIFDRQVMLKYLHICPDGFSFSTTSTVVFLNRKLRVAWTPIAVKPRTGKSTVSAGTGFEALLLLLRLASLFEPLRVFLPFSASLGLIGLGWAIPHALAGRGLSVGALLLITSGVILFSMGMLLDQISASRKERFE